MTQKEKFDLDTNRLQNNCHLVNSLIEVDSWRDSIQHDLDVPKRAFGVPVEFLQSKCPKCGAPEVEAATAFTVYKCGSLDYDQRPGTFNQSDQCKDKSGL